MSPGNVCASPFSRTLRCPIEAGRPETSNVEGYGVEAPTDGMLMVVGDVTVVPGAVALPSAVAQVTRAVDASEPGLASVTVKVAVVVPPFPS